MRCGFSHFSPNPSFREFSMMSSNCCIYCHKGCKNSDSRPYPNSKSKERIHNKCQLKKGIADKKQPAVANPSASLTSNESSFKLSDDISSTLARAEKAAQDELNAKRAEEARKMAELMADMTKRDKDQSSRGGQFFFDLKAGIAKPNEKRRYLHHRNLSEIASRYDDNGFAEEAIGRAYDHTGKDLNTLGDESDQDDDRAEDYANKESQRRSGKRKSDLRSQTETKQTKVKLDEKNPCWFCLSSPMVEKHLIIAIGNYCYLTLAKGGLNDEHLLLIPIDHINSINDKRNSTELLEELSRFKESLVKYFGKRTQGVVFFERNFRSVHWQLQVVPIPLDIIDTVEENIKALSKEHFKHSNYIDIPANCTLRDMIPPGKPYFYWHLEPNGSRFVTQIQLVAQQAFFPIQFGRLVMADSKILDCPDKIDWTKCTKSKEDYVKLATQTKEMYKEFDIT